MSLSITVVAADMFFSERESRRDDLRRKSGQEVNFKIERRNGKFSKLEKERENGESKSAVPRTNFFPSCAGIKPVTTRLEVRSITVKRTELPIEIVTSY